MSTHEFVYFVRLRNMYDYEIGSFRICVNIYIYIYMTVSVIGIGIVKYIYIYIYRSLSGYKGINPLKHLGLLW